VAVLLLCEAFPVSRTAVGLPKVFDLGLRQNPAKAVRLELGAIRADQLEGGGECRAPSHCWHCCCVFHGLVGCWLEQGGEKHEEDDHERGHHCGGEDVVHFLPIRVLLFFGHLF